MPIAAGVFVPGHAQGDLRDVELEDEVERREREALLRAPTLEFGSLTQDEGGTPEPKRLRLSPSTIQRVDSSLSLEATLLEEDGRGTGLPPMAPASDNQPVMAPANDSKPNTPSDAKGGDTKEPGAGNLSPPVDAPQQANTPAQVAVAGQAIQMEGTIYTDGTYWKTRGFSMSLLSCSQDQPLRNAAQEGQRTSQSGDGEALRNHGRA